MHSTVEEHTLESGSEERVAPVECHIISHSAPILSYDESTNTTPNTH